MEKHKEIGYKLGDVLFHNLYGYKELWNNAGFDIKEKIINDLGRLAMELCNTNEETYVKINSDFFIWKWTGDPKTIADIEKRIEPYKDIYSISETSTSYVLCLSKKLDNCTSNSYVYLDQYIIFDLNNEDDNHFYCCGEEYFEKEFKKV
jgi:hypothetical protein